MRRRLIGIGLITVAVTIAVIATMFRTSPDELGPFGITSWFIGLFIMTLGWCWVGLSVVRRVVFESESPLRDFRQALLITSWLLILLGLNSLRQLDGADIVIVTLLVVALEFYLRKVV